SSSRTMRRTPCVLGCCGPMLTTIVWSSRASTWTPCAVVAAVFSSSRRLLSIAILVFLPWLAGRRQLRSGAAIRGRRADFGVVFALRVASLAVEGLARMLHRDFAYRRAVLVAGEPHAFAAERVVFALRMAHPVV